MSDNDNNGAAGANNGNTELDESKLPKFAEIDPANASPEEVGEVIKAAQTLLGQSKHWRGKAIDPETKKPWSEIAAEAKKNTQKPPAPAQEQDGELRKDVDFLKTSEEKRQFGHSNKLTPEETDNLFAFAQGTGLKPKEALEHPFFKAGLEAFRQAEQNSSATPRPSSRAPVVEGKAFGEMKPDEKRKNFGKVVEALSKK